MTVVGTIIKADKIILYITQDNKTPLQYAAESGHSDVVQIPLDKRANVEAVDDVTNKYLLILILYDIAQDNKTPLHYAAESGSSDVVQILLDNGANIEAVDEVTNKYSLILIL